MRLVNNMNQCAIGFLCSAVLLLASGCASSVASNPSSRDPSSTLSPNATSVDTTVGEQLKDDDSAALDSLWKARLHDTAGGPSSDSFMLGPGDLLRISVPPIQQRTVRVSEENKIALPLLGEIDVTGMGEEDLRAALAARMVKYRHHPEVGVFLEQAEDRQVAVLGAVKTPARYMLSSRSDTLMTAIGRAGGVTEGAASRIVLLPASAADLHSKAAAPSLNVASAGSPIIKLDSAVESQARVGDAMTHPSSELTPVLAKFGDEQLVIDMSQARSKRYLEIPARPGDVILVPLAGEVTVEGWVAKAGSFKVTPDMTVLNAIAAAGGALFSSSARLLREKPDGGKEVVALDLGKIKRGEQPDPQVEGADLIVVERSALGALPYSAYFLVQHVGLGLPIF